MPEKNKIKNVMSVESDQKTQNGGKKGSKNYTDNIKLAS